MFLMLSNSDGVSGATGQTITPDEVQPGLTSFGSVQGSAATEVGVGWYYVTLNDNDTIWPGELAFDMAGSSAISTDFVDQVQLQTFVVDMPLTSGSFSQQSHLKKNTRWSRLMFLMIGITSNQAKTGLSPVSMRALDGGGFANTFNTVTEVGQGVYALTLEATDTNANLIQLAVTAPGANPVYMEFTTT